MPIAMLKKSLSILMPAYNEEKNIERVVRRCIEVLKELNIKGEVVVTNDGSTDRTRQILEGLQKEISNLVVVNHEINLGYGQGLLDAIRASSGDLIVTIDSDGQFDIKELPILINKFQEGYKVVAGYRKEKKDSFLKVLANKCLAMFTNLMFGLGLKDTNSAFKLFEGNLLRSLNIESRGYQTPTEIMVKLKNMGIVIPEVAISHSFREQGRSALKVIRTTFDMLIFLFYLKLKVYLYNKKIINKL